MLSDMVWIVVVIAAVLAALRWFGPIWFGGRGSGFGRAGVVEQWRLLGTAEDVLVRRLHASLATVDASVIGALDRPDLRWRLAEAARLIEHQLRTCAGLPHRAKPAVRREVEATVREFEAVCARLLLEAAQASSAEVRARLSEIEDSVAVLRSARAEIEAFDADH